MKILITGASGFIGQHLLASINQMAPGKSTVRSAVRVSPTERKGLDIVTIGEIGPDTDWSKALDSIDIVIHLAGCAHQKDSSALNDNYKFETINSEGTRNLAAQAVKHNVKRFIYMSSVKVYGENISDHLILSEDSELGVDCDAYGLSKLKAEQHLIKIADNSQMDFVIIRSPLVYGPGVIANFQSLIKLLKTGLPLPFASINNQRSMIAIDNLVDFIQCCIVNKEATNQIFLVSDGDDVSLLRLSTLIRNSLGLSPRLFTLPLFLLKITAGILGKSRELGKLTNSFQVNTDKAANILNWKPVIKIEDAITKTVTNRNVPGKLRESEIEQRKT